MRLLIAAVLASFFTVGAAFAQGGSDPVAEMIACSSVRGDKARLKCFERNVPALREAFPGAVALAEAKEKEARAEALADAREEFGLRNESDAIEEKDFGAEDLTVAGAADDNEYDDDGNIKAINAGVVEVGKTPRGKIIVVLDNGQVWRQLDADTSTPYIRHNTDGMTATVKKAALGSYTLRISGTRESFKVSRVK